MNANKYEVNASTSGLEYSFTSTGVKGDIQKIVQYSIADEKLPDIYNLAFGDLTEDGEIVDSVVSNNGDLTTVMATVIGTIKHFSKLHPDKKVFFRGVDDRRHSLYHTILTRNYAELSKDFNIYGLKEYIEPDTNELVTLPLPFQTNGNYKAYLIVKK